MDFPSLTYLNGEGNLKSMDAIDANTIIACSERPPQYSGVMSNISTLCDSFWPKKEKLGGIFVKKERTRALRKEISLCNSPTR